MSLVKFKAVARHKAKIARDHAHQRISSVASLEICGHINKFLRIKKNFKIVAVYMPIQTEIDIRPLIPVLRDLGKILCLPAIISDKEPLNFLVLTEESRLVRGKFGVLIPETNSVVDPDLILCPMLSFDSKGFRLGYGGGFYDRTIHCLGIKKPIFTLGCAYSEQIALGVLPVGKFDKPLNAVATENGITFFDI